MLDSSRKEETADETRRADDDEDRVNNIGQFGSSLRKIYRASLEEPISDELQQLLDRLD